MKDSPGYHKRTDWVDFKKVIWHEGFKRILESVQVLSKVGCVVRCGDGIERKLFPYVHILAADYEEQYVEFYFTFLVICLFQLQMCYGFDSRPYGQMSLSYLSCS